MIKLQATLTSKRRWKRKRREEEERGRGMRKRNEVTNEVTNTSEPPVAINGIQIHEWMNGINK
jgi:hypothetical protein